MHVLRSYRRPFSYAAGLAALALAASIGCSSRHASDESEDALETEESEARLFAKSADIVEAQIRAAYAAEPANERVGRRDAHSKHHGCLRADFRVRNDVPAALRHGVFREANKNFPAWIRMSNGGGGIKDDHKPDARGMAIKLVGVTGDKLLDGNDRTAQTQDFLMVNHPVFFIRNPTEYVEFQRVLAEDGSPTRFFAPGLNLGDYHVKAAMIVAKTLSTIQSPLNTRFWSMAPYRLGPNVVKFSAKPCDEAPPPPADSGTLHYLKDAMVQTLTTQSASSCFQFMVQTQTNANDMPTEDLTVEWPETPATPFVPVADIKIAAQTFDTPEQQKYCENLSFTPWHALPDHEPLGGLNRMRRVVYERASKVRHELNVTQRDEPKTPERMEASALELQ